MVEFRICARLDHAYRSGPVRCRVKPDQSECNSSVARTCGSQRYEHTACNVELRWNPTDLYRDCTRCLHRVDPGCAATTCGGFGGHSVAVWRYTNRSAVDHGAEHHGVQL